MSENGQIDIWYTVGEEGVALLDHQTMHPTAKYPYDTIVTFGGCQVIVIKHTRCKNQDVSKSS